MVAVPKYFLRCSKCGSDRGFLVEDKLIIPETGKVAWKESYEVPGQLYAETIKVDVRISCMYCKKNIWYLDFKKDTPASEEKKARPKFERRY